jgi:hypothetical protein
LGIFLFSVEVDNTLDVFRVEGERYLDRISLVFRDLRDQMACKLDYLAAKKPSLRQLAIGSYGTVIAKMELRDDGCPSNGEVRIWATRIFRIMANQGTPWVHAPDTLGIGY